MVISQNCIYFLSHGEIIDFELVFDHLLSEAYDALDPNGNITIKWDVITWTPDGYVVSVGSNLEQ